MKYSLLKSLMNDGVAEVFYHPDPLPKMIKIGEYDEKNGFRVYKDSSKHEQPAKQFLFDYEKEQYEKRRIEAYRAATS